MRLLLAALIWAAFLWPAHAQPCFTRQAVSHRLIAKNPQANVAVTARGQALGRLITVFNRTPPTTTTLSANEVGYADIWSKPRSDDALVVFYGRTGCFVAYMRTLVRQLKSIFPNVDFAGVRA